MSEAALEEVRERWNLLADDWRLQVGDDEDSNRRLNSDPVLWAFAGDVSGLVVLDAGCGTGYLSRKLRDRGARVTGVDFAATGFSSSEVRSRPCRSPGGFTPAKAKNVATRSGAFGVCRHAFSAATVPGMETSNGER